MAMPVVQAGPTGGTVTQGGWEITSKKGHILNSNDVDSWSDSLQITLPEMVFGYNSWSFVFKNSGVGISLNAYDALKDCKDSKRPQVEVVAAREWKQKDMSAHPDVKKLEMDYDWTYTTAYTGTIMIKDEKAGSDIQGPGRVEATEEEINMEMLKAREPMLYYDDVVLFEDELHDNGIASLSCKVRVMPSCWFCLMRFGLRVDGVLFRVVDTRIFAEYGKDYVIREYQFREGKFQDLDVPDLQLKDPQELIELLDITERRLEKIYVK
eukprot:GFYU01003467.1.p1 GENE.GFYU01003467.1~~GFYU01003467.1.p1  ORF type:complete len:267 (+),score=78.37 GFYU01003467.1:152-952(+)